VKHGDEVMTSRNLHCLFAAVFLFLLCFPATSGAFFEWQGENGFVETRGLIRGFGTILHYPEDAFFYKEKTDAGAATFARLMTHAGWGNRFHFEINAYQTYIPNDLLAGQGDLGTPLDTERSGALEWRMSHDEYIRLALDRLNIRAAFDRLDLIVGRQPINLATTFYFTPNDFFAPFSAQAFYRVYKPGVDALRAEIRTGPLSQLSLMRVLGYQRDQAGETDWRESPNSGRTAHLGRFSNVFHDMEWAFIAGRVREEDVIGGALQGELFDWLGLRIEGHSADPKENGASRHTELSVGLEHRWENTLNARFEFFHHGKGAKRVSDYQAAFLANTDAYLARRYAALGVAYEFTPLFTGDVLLIMNLIDRSRLTSLNGVYSLSDEAELVLNMGVPAGKTPNGSKIESEFGLAPYVFTVEGRLYF